MLKAVIELPLQQSYFQEPTRLVDDCSVLAAQSEQRHTMATFSPLPKAAKYSSLMVQGSAVSQLAPAFTVNCPSFPAIEKIVGTKYH